MAEGPDPAIDRIELLVLDVDGVLTDGSIRIDDHGVETKRFYVRDGTGIRLWQRLGYQVAILTGRSGMAVRHRAAELGVVHVIQGADDKPANFGLLLAELELKASQAAFVGDDLPDLTVMRLAGYALAVADAVPEIVAAADFHLTARGGHGAVREAIEHLLKAKGRWEEAVALMELHNGPPESEPPHESEPE